MTRKLAVFDAYSPLGTNPWVTDGTAAGTFVLGDILRVPSSSLSDKYTGKYGLLASGKAVFLGEAKADPSTYGIYVTDGTVAGTKLITLAGSSLNRLAQLVTLSDGRVLVELGDKNASTTSPGAATLWVTDGTAAGTTLFKTIPYTGQATSDLVSFGNGRATFTVPTSNFSQLYATDGTAAGTVPLLQTYGGIFYGGKSMTALGNGRAIFSSNTSPTDYRQTLYVTDSTAAGTVKLNDLVISPPVSIGNGKVVFYAESQVFKQSGLYVSDGTAGGTVLLQPLDSLYFNKLTSVGSGLAAYSVGTAQNASGQYTALQVFLTDGTVAGTRLLKLIPNIINATAAEYTPLNDGRFLFRVSNGYQTGLLWVSDGTTSGTAEIDPANTQGLNFQPDNFAAIGDGYAVFGGTMLTDNGHELWVTDGTLAGTTLVKDINPGIASSNIANVLVLAAAPAAPFVFKIVPLDANKPDGDGGLTPYTFTVTRSGDLTLAASVTYSAAGSGTSPTPPTLVFNPVGIASFAAGAASTTITLNVQGAQILTTETFAVTLGGAAPNDPNATATGTVQPTAPPVSLDALFDIAYYLAHVSGVTAAGAYAHFLATGWKLGLDPSALFSTTYYLAHNPDVKASGINPLLHFEQVGAAQGRDPSALFSVSDYLAANPDVKAAGVNALTHYLNSGKGEGRLAIAPGTSDPGVDAAAYYAANPDVRAAGVDAAQHYNSSGWHEGRNPNAYFDTNYYLAQNPDVKAAGVDPLTHFETTGWKEGREPSLQFSDARYLAANPDVKAAGVNPLLHYLTNGHNEGRIAFLSPNTKTDPVLDVRYYDRQAGLTPSADPIAAAVQAAASYDSVGWQRGLNPSALFDTAYYLRQNPDVAAAHINPLLHFETFGWKEGRNASAAFSTPKYLAAYADVKAAGIDPLVHYLQNGQAEGRSAFSV